MRIACVAYLHGAGGAERQIIMLANNLSAHHDVSLIVLAENNCKYFIDDRVRVFDLSQKEKNKPFKPIIRLKAIKKVYKVIRPNITIHFWMQSAFLTLLIKKSLRGKVVYSERGDPTDKEYKGFRKIIQNTTFKNVDGVVFQTDFAKSAVGKRLKSTFTVIHNAVSVPFDMYNEPCPNPKFRIINVGRLHPQKNQICLLEAFNIIKDEYPDLSLEIYGDGLLKDFLKDEIIKKELDKRVHIYSSTPNILDIIYHSTIFVLSSDYEGMPNVLLEAMSLGVPCISTDYKPGGARELIEDGKNGLLVQTNSPFDMALAIKRILDNPSFGIDLAADAMSIKKSHLPDNIYSLWERFLERIVL